MEEINVLFSSVGRRVELVNYFRRASKKLNIKSKLIGIDNNETAPGLRFVDNYYLVPKVTDSNFISKVIKICKKENISMIIPTIDPELILYSENKEKIFKESGAKVIVSDLNSIKIMRDKIKTEIFLKEKGFKVPKTITKEDIKNKNYNFPLFIKPLNGSSSFNNFKINSEKELEFFKNYVPNPLIQEFIDGTEYCVDVFNDLDSNIITAVPKNRLAFREGEITKGRIEKDKKIIEISKNLMKVLPSIGEINFDCMKKDGEIYILEINGRFAGGAPMSFESGADSPMNLYKIFSGEKLEYNENYKDNMLSLRFDTAIFE
ncbi:MAG: ATP-grasp domain-containing protein [Fusobacterium sp. JB019]|nr:ATP-grasp domain-containing protein [Fusobacterium sp. JB019]